MIFARVEPGMAVTKPSYFLFAVKWGNGESCFDRPLGMATSAGLSPRPKLCATPHFVFLFSIAQWTYLVQSLHHVQDVVKGFA